ncbi:Cholinesterase [Tolypocladium ophioglossoides CBS 100239]|uniref:Cholinesterase n=1 Tax=Tolypocladium ophioglossoides (strain CBS 100239) TaxID=1163406 RepID=A0A0L0NHV4_TOLOC|nr:Cholinesterase [Tolypocladium ophioglossoides CBS 100239]
MVCPKKKKKELVRKDLPAGTHCLRGQVLAKEIIRETDRILTYEVDTEKGISWIDYHGVYRREDVQAGLHQFVDWVLVRSAIARMMSSMNRNLGEATKSRETDLIAFSAKYCHNFVNIHPFMDGNGRVCRLILNAILLKYGGNVVCIGKQGDDRDKYLGLVTAASQRESSQRDDFDDDDPLAPKYYNELATFTLQHFTENVQAGRTAKHILHRRQQPRGYCDHNGFITVETQYRLGTSGYLASAHVTERGHLNAGLLDQQFALEWVQKCIAKFGGGPNRVAIGGESSCVGSDIYLIGSDALASTT